VVIAALLYILGLFGYVGFFPLDQELAVGLLAVAGILLLLGTLTQAL
jgi:hypothetical protein